MQCYQGLPRFGSRRGVFWGDLAGMATTLDQNLTVTGVGTADAFLVATVQLSSLGLLAVEGFDDLIRLTVA